MPRLKTPHRSSLTRVGDLVDSSRVHGTLAHPTRWLWALILLACGFASEANADQAKDAPALPKVASPRVIVVDAATDAILFARAEREVAAIASTGKIFVGLTVREQGIDLSAKTKITKVDRNLARGGARTRLPVGHKFKNLDLLRAMLIASDNRAPSALGRAVGLPPKKLIAAMNERARALGLQDTEFTDTSGLRGNTSTAHDLAVALKAALADSVLAEVMGTRDVHVRASHRKARRIYYRNTNQVLHSEKYEVLGGKTGFTRKAGYCLLVAARIEGRDVIMVFLGGKKKYTRFRDFYKVARWLAKRPEFDLESAARLGDPRE